MTEAKRRQRKAGEGEPDAVDQTAAVADVAATGADAPAAPPAPTEEVAAPAGDETAGDGAAQEDAGQPAEEPSQALEWMRAQEEVEAIFVRSLPPSFRRAGYRFTRAGHGLLLRNLTDEQYQAITSEPMLAVEHCTVKVPKE
jgi:hypothetical protein